MAKMTGWRPIEEADDAVKILAKNITWLPGEAAARFGYGRGCFYVFWCQSTTAPVQFQRIEYPR